MKRPAFTVVLRSGTGSSRGRSGRRATRRRPSHIHERRRADSYTVRASPAIESGGIAPMALVTYQDARPWAKAIKQQVGSRQMPPWGADQRHGRFKNDRSLREAEIRTIAAWADQGALKGNDADLAAPPVFAERWTHREPDVIIEMPVEFEVPAKGKSTSPIST